MVMLEIKLGQLTLQTIWIKETLKLNDEFGICILLPVMSNIHCQEFIQIYWYSK